MARKVLEDQVVILELILLFFSDAAENIHLHHLKQKGTIVRVFLCPIFICIAVAFSSFLSWELNSLVYFLLLL